MGAEIQVNNESYGMQGRWRGADVAAGANGGFEIVWDGYGHEKGGRRFAGDGTTLAPEFDFGLPANPYDFGDDPAIPSNAGGNFVVVWRTFGADGGEIWHFSRRCPSVDESRCERGHMSNVYEYASVPFARV